MGRMGLRNGIWAEIGGDGGRGGGFGMRIGETGAKNGIWDQNQGNVGLGGGVE